MWIPAEGKLNASLMVREHGSFMLKEEEFGVAESHTAEQEIFRDEVAGVYSSIQQTFLGHLLCVRHCGKTTPSDTNKEMPSWS